MIIRKNPINKQMFNASLIAPTISIMIRKKKLHFIDPFSVLFVQIKYKINLNFIDAKKSMQP